MPRVSEDDLTDEMVIRKLTYQFDRTLQLLECLTVDKGEPEPFVSVVGSYSQRKMEFAAEQALTGWSLPKDTTCSECGQTLVPYKRVTVVARRPPELLTWFLNSCVCDECEATLDPKPESMDVVASAWITKWDDPEDMRPMMLSEISVEESSGTHYRGDVDMEVTE